jgi:hypothetical protein
MKTKIAILFLIFFSVNSQAAVQQTVRTSAKLTEYYLKKGKSSSMKFDHGILQVGNRLEDRAPDEKTVQTNEIKLTKELSRNEQFAKVKATAEEMGRFKIENVDESRHTEKICMTNKKEKVCHSSINLELTVSSRPELGRTALNPESN